MRGFGPVGASPAAASIAGETDEFCVSDPIYNISTLAGVDVGSLTLSDTLGSTVAGVLTMILNFTIKIHMTL